MSAPTITLLRQGAPYRSLDQQNVVRLGTDESAATVTFSNSRVRDLAIRARRGLPSSASTELACSPRYRVIEPHPEPTSSTLAPAGMFNER